jgi:trehalose utilization protein
MLLDARLLAASAQRKVVVVWSEGTANGDSASKKVYPEDINTAIADGLKPLQGKGWEIVKASLNDPDQGLGDDLLKRTYVLIWWGHKKHRDVDDELVSKIEKRVREEGMGFIATHSAHFSRPLKRLLGTPCSWREYVADGTLVWLHQTDHPGWPAGAD